MFFGSLKNASFVTLRLMSRLNVRLTPFLVADTQLYKRLCPSVGPSVRRSVGPLVRENESKSGKSSVLEAFFVCVCVRRGVRWGVGCGWGLAAPAHPSATIL